MNTARTLTLSILILLLFTADAVTAPSDLQIVNAAADHDAAAVRALLKSGADVNARRADGSTALLWIAHWGDVETASLLLRAGADVNAATDYGVTPLALAVENGEVPLVETLLNAGANANSARKSGLTSLMIAAHSGNVPVVKVLLKHGADVKAATVETKANAFMWAVSDGFPEIAKLLIAAHADVHASSADGLTALHYAARNGDIEMARILLDAGANVNDAGSDRTHVLPFAIVCGQGKFAEFLLEHGADPNGEMGGIRALHAASGGVGLWLTDWNLKHGGGIRSAKELDAASRLRLVKALLAQGADPNTRTTTSAMVMGYIGHPRKGAFEPFACGTGDLKGATPLWIAAAYAANGISFQQIMENTSVNRIAGSSEIIRTLLAGGADQRLTTDDGTTPFMVAAGLGGNTFTPGRTRGYPVPTAEEAVKILLDAGADINAVNEADFTALHGAAFRGLNEVVKFLVEHGADINARDFRGRTPYRLAEGSKQSFQFQAFSETAELLKDLGANTRLGIPGNVQERARDVASASR